MMLKVVVTELRCERCSHKWIARKPKPPKVCPECKRSNWMSKKEPRITSADETRDGNVLKYNVSAD